MPIQKSGAIILRSQALRETSLILTFYTEGFGKINGIVRGVRGPHAQYGGGSLEIFAHDEIIFYERKKSDIFTVSQCDLIEFFNPIRQSLERLAYASYMAELLDSVTSPGDKNAEVFFLLLNSLKLLSGESSARRVARIFEIKLLNLLGLMPTLGTCANCGNKTDMPVKFSVIQGGLICKNCLGADKNAMSILPGTVKFIEHIRGSSFERVARLKVVSSVGKELEAILRKFLDYHIERRLKSLEFLKEIEK
ncbi:MAG: DNA repair protein RecO [Omnitrophica bacterium RIFCSPLOWO2_02_FULL_45_16]|nr:MAG: DNA repair protein RecO [Omnitrophica bacterium RIFCSPHIGHO2_02_FULL_46_20]OGW93775.1 MAG: DNA repair protein RecO [Omnitrophica bacterium RIFCSPLOWO2_01_FULL_45_24]OGW94120.1 MAG: DNA repair protein RecO [Omnitrophica bacterium RIFCSPLOWO2_12_FULL_45_13]OGX00820.1 MAG: DNA repair protein RecO [Omnitrophica bacterium RIFCSPLOWO2_02_FULL_45_16]